MDRYLGQALKKWASSERPPLAAKKRVLQKAARLSLAPHKSTFIFIIQFFQSFGHLDEHPSQEYAAMFFPFTQLPARLLGLRL
jgi:hypothetical protein